MNAVGKGFPVGGNLKVVVKQAKVFGGYVVTVATFNRIWH